MAINKFTEIDNAANAGEVQYFGKSANGWDGEEETRKAVEAADRYNGEEGLSRLELAAGLTSEGDELYRLSSLISLVSAKVLEWEGAKRSALLQDHELISCLFSVTDKVNISAYVNSGRLPDTWWARLALALDELGIWDRLTAQIHRETMAQVARDVTKEERSLGGKNKAANAKPNPDKAKALDYASKHPGASAVQIKTRAKLRASERTIRGWISAGC